MCPNDNEQGPRTYYYGYVLKYNCRKIDKQKPQVN